MNWAAYPRFKNRVADFRDWQIRQLEKAGVNVVLNKALDANSPELENADKIFVAVGSKPAILPIKGHENSNVVEVTYSHDHSETIKGQKIVVCGDGMTGCDAAIDLAMDGKDVTIIEMASKLAQTEDVIPNVIEMMDEISKYNVKTYVNTKVVEFLEDKVIANCDGNIIEIPADTIITSFGMKPDYSFAETIIAKYPNAEALGDCTNSHSKIAGAIHSAFFAAYKV